MSDTGSRVVGMLSAKGGVGTTTLAVNLALCLARRRGTCVTLWDWGSGRDGGAEAVLSPSMGQNAGTGAITLRTRLEAFEGSKVDGEADLRRSVAGDQEGAIAVVDLGMADAPPWLLRQLDTLILVGTPDVPAVRGLQFLFKTISSLLGGVDRMQIIVNRTRAGDTVTASDVQASVGCPVIVTVPDDRQAVQDAANNGEGIVWRHPDSAVSKAVNRLADKLLSRVASKSMAMAPVAKAGEQVLDHSVFRKALHERILTRLGPETRPEQPVSRQAVERAANLALLEMPEAECLTRDDQRRLVREVAAEMVGLGPLERYLGDRSISEIMVNGHQQLFVERTGRLEKANGAFASDEQVLRVIERIIGPLGRRIDESSPMVDARLPDGSRINAVISPLSVDGPLLTIRKFAATPWNLADLVQFGTLNEGMARLLAACVRSRKSMIIAGGAGSGKTTLLNVLSGFIPDSERIITIEDAAELRLQQEHVVRLEARPANIEGQGAVTIRDLVRNALRMRPDRIIVGEVRGGEALDMLQAMNTGHLGSMSTVHANSPRDALSRLETMVLMSGMELPVRAIREQIAAALELVVHQERLRDGSRKITAISEVCGLQDGQFVMRDLYVLDAEGAKSGSGPTVKFVETGAAQNLARDLGLVAAKREEIPLDGRGVA